MQIQLDILRGGPGRSQYLQSILFVYEDENATVATALTEINRNPEQKDLAGNPVATIRWDCSCLQKKCGACAMRINGVPRLACDTPLSEFSKKGKVLLEPLKKFPLVADLMVDRSILHENLKTIGVWLRGNASSEAVDEDMAYEGSRCLQCGCCLEVCPNFYAGGKFSGMAGFVPTTRLLSEMAEGERKEIYRAYRKHIYNGCGKSLACRNICPAGIDIEGLLVNSNAMAVWKRRTSKKQR